MSKQRKRDTIEFKQEAVELWESSGQAAAEIEQDLGITPGLLYLWQGRLRKQAAAEADGSVAEMAELRRLRNEPAIVKQERDLLKKAVSIFSRPKE